MPTAKSLGALQSMLLNKMAQTMSVAEKKMETDMLEETSGVFPNGGTPKIYERTGNYESSPKTDGVKKSGTSVHTTARLDDSNPYSTGSYSTNKVFEEVQHNGSGIVGAPGTWDRSKDKMKQSVMETFAQMIK